jgi:hypothetical protein
VTTAAAGLAFAAWEACVFGASARIAQRAMGKARAAEFWLAVLAIDMGLEASIAAALSFAHWNSAWAYGLVAAALAGLALWGGLRLPRWEGWRAKAPAPLVWPLLAALAVPVILTGFRPVEEIDSINYLHYLIDWMGNRGNPYDFANYYVPFWELSFLPSWTVTRLDVFFPLVALKPVILMGLGLWLIGRELEVPETLLAWTVFGALAMRHYWLEYAGTATLKHDAMAGAGFVLLALVVLRAARRPLERRDVALFALGLAFASVKFLGVFTGTAAFVAMLWLTRKQAGLAWRAAWPAAVALAATGHYYLHSWLRFGNPFYPYQIHLGPIHLPGEGEISGTSILYSLGDGRLWRALFWPAGAMSPAGILFPEILAGILLVCGWRCGRWAWRRGKGAPADWLAVLILISFLLYFRSFYSASFSPGDLGLILNSLNSLRYVEGVLAVSEVFLVWSLGRYALPLVLINAASRLLLVYGRMPQELWAPAAVCAMAAAVAAAVYFARRWAWAVAAVGLIAATPAIVERNRAHWTVYWNDLRPAVAAVRGPELACFAMNEASYWAGHLAAAGNPIDPRVRALLPEDVEAMAPAERPRFLAVLVTPGFDWRAHYAGQIARWGYTERKGGADGALFEK